MKKLRYVGTKSPIIKMEWIFGEINELRRIREREREDLSVMIEWNDTTIIA